MPRNPPRIRSLSAIAAALIAAVVLAACANGLPTPARYVPPQTKAGRVCAEQCLKARKHCAISCTLSERQCNQDMQAQAIRDYESYMRERFVSRAAPEFLPRDFERPEKCLDASCRRDCEDNYRDCHENCGGSIAE